MQDLSELTDQLDLDAALARTHERHRELLHERAVRRRIATTGAFAAVIVAAVVLLPQLGSDDRGQAVRFAGPGGSSTAGPAASQGAGEATGGSSTPHLPRPSVVSSDFDLSEDASSLEGVVFVLTRKPETLADVPVTKDGEAAVGSGIDLTRTVELSGVEAVTGHPDALTAHFVCTGMADEITEVRYRFEGSRLLIDATVRSAPQGVPCAAGGAGPSVTLPLDREWQSTFDRSAVRL